MDWLYEDHVPTDPEIFTGIYKAACRYHIKELCTYTVSQIEQLKDNAELIISMMRIALEQRDEDTIRKTVAIFKANPSLRQNPEYQEQLGKYGLQLVEHFMKY